ncbi:LysR family transcriptional regulator [Oceanobacter mangrovi]|uniref:LysR family transcriptional regulator n=1 Tax=Oceanobacter mangrovi TaxID=2862510 RepID=UPI001C8D56F2|nr:LysR family transcriptional regulator [Oceanobacter mangrovi]
MKFNYSLDDMRCFCAVVRSGSFKQASEVLGIPHSTLSRRIAKLEQDLQLRLLNRDAHKVQMTLTGQQYFDRCCHLFDELNEVAISLYQDKHKACGRIRVAAPVNFGSHVLTPHFNAFLQQYPDINLDLRLSNQHIDLEEAAIDIAFRVGEHTAGHWIGRHLTDFRFMICGPARLPLEKIEHPSELARLPLLMCHPMSTWPLQHNRSRELYTFDPATNARMEVDDIAVLTRAVRDGLGVGFIPDYHAQPLIEAGELVRLLPDWSNQPRSCQLLYRDRHNMPHRVRLLIDFMLQRFAS